MTRQFPPSPVPAPSIVVAIIAPPLELVKSVLTFWSLVNSAGFGHRARYQSLCRSLRRSSECLVRSSSAYDAKIQRVPGPSSTALCGFPGNASRVHTQVGHMIDTHVELCVGTNSRPMR